MTLHGPKYKKTSVFYKKINVFMYKSYFLHLFFYKKHMFFYKMYPARPCNYPARHACRPAGRLAIIGPCSMVETRMHLGVEPATASVQPAGRPAGRLDGKEARRRPARPWAAPPSRAAVHPDRRVDATAGVFIILLEMIRGLPNNLGLLKQPGLK